MKSIYPSIASSWIPVFGCDSVMYWKWRRDRCIGIYVSVSHAIDQPCVLSTNQTILFETWNKLELRWNWERTKNPDDSKRYILEWATPNFPRLVGSSAQNMNTETWNEFDVGNSLAQNLIWSRRNTVSEEVPNCPRKSFLSFQWREKWYLSVVSTFWRNTFLCFWNYVAEWQGGSFVVEYPTYRICLEHGPFLESFANFTNVRHLWVLHKFDIK